MAQFTHYASSDTSAPVLSGTVGTLIAVLDGCLVTGYGSKAAAGWTHPVATSGNIASYKQPAGAGLSLVVNDNAPNNAFEAWAIGWESVTTVGANYGTGTARFPTSGQQDHITFKKTNAANSTPVVWHLFADSTTFYLFIVNTNGFYYASCFGDIFSVKGNTDAYRCFICGTAGDNTLVGASQGLSQLQGLVTATPGIFIARTYGGGGVSITAGIHGDSVKGSATGWLGILQYPNGPDSALYLSPIFITENTTSTVRGRLRGLYQPLHANANFSDGQTFVGASDYAGKSFYLLGLNPGTAQGNYVIETSNTLETN